jgi:8-oxo-dGTP pyrophosphatase MutT (NUDIX family)
LKGTALPRSNREDGRQVAALPVAKDTDGRIHRVLLVTSRETRRWVIPKGWPWRGHPDHEAAAAEAREEAGAVGAIGEAVHGTYCYEKGLSNGSQTIAVSVYLLDVAELLDAWPEAPERERRWFEVAEAANAVAEPDLAELIARLTDAD